MGYVTDPGRPDLGGNIRNGDEHSWCPTLWQHLVSHFSIRSVLDVGCGEGHAVLFFQQLGLSAHGIDGLGLNVHRAVTPICQHDLTEGIYSMPVDLVWSCEVAEHIDPAKVENYVSTLANARVIAMTHAIPGQGGYHHVNEQPTEYWINLISAHGYHLYEHNELLRKIADQEQTWTYFGRTGLVFTRGVNNEQC